MLLGVKELQARCDQIIRLNLAKRESPVPEVEAADRLLQLCEHLLATLLYFLLPSQVSSGGQVVEQGQVDLTIGQLDLLQIAVLNEKLSPGYDYRLEAGTLFLADEGIAEEKQGCHLSERWVPLYELETLVDEFAPFYPFRLAEPLGCD